MVWYPALIPAGEAELTPNAPRRASSGASGRVSPGIATPSCGAAAARTACRRARAALAGAVGASHQPPGRGRGNAGDRAAGADWRPGYAAGGIVAEPGVESFALWSIVYGSPF